MSLVRVCGALFFIIQVIWVDGHTVDTSVTTEWVFHGTKRGAGNTGVVYYTEANYYTK